MKKLLLILFTFFAINLINAQVIGKYIPHSYKASYSEEVKESKNSVIEITNETISVKVGDNNPFIYQNVDARETKEGDVEIVVLGTDYKHYMFTVGVSKGEVFILYQESKESYIIYYCDKVK